MKKILFVIASSAYLLGCQSLQVEHDVPELVTTETVTSDWFFDKDLSLGTEIVVDDWWLVLNEPALNSLVDTALENNASLAVSTATIKQSEANLAAIEAGFMPTIGASATASREKTTLFGIRNFSQVGVNFDYALDLFGNNASLENAAEFQYQQQLELMSFGKSLIAANVVASYIQYHAIGEQIRILNEQLAAQARTKELNELLYNEGEISLTQVDLVSTEYHLLQAQVNENNRLQDEVKLNITELLGADVPYVDAILNQYPSQMVTFDSLPLLKNKMDVIASRPDIKALEYQVLAANQITKNQLQSIYPDLSISGFFGLADAGFSLTETVWSIAANAAINLIDFGRLEAAENVERAKEETAVAQYRETVSSAIVEVEQVLKDIASYQQQVVDYGEATVSAKRAYDNVELLFREGEVSVLNVLDAQRTYNQSQQRSIQAQTNVQMAIASLYKVLAH